MTAHSHYAIRELYASNNHINELQPDVSNLANLESLDVCNNMLRIVPAELGHLKNLKTINLGQVRDANDVVVVLTVIMAMMMEVM